MPKGIILAGGSGTRLHPATLAVSKQLLPIYDKPMIYYPLSTLMLSGVRDILIISTPDDTPRFEKALGSGQQWGIHIEYAVQPYPRGLADAFLVGEEFIANEPCALMLGDNILYGTDYVQYMRAAAIRNDGATVFAYQVRDPERYGVVVMSEDGKPMRLVEKPTEYISDLAITGIYFYDQKVVSYAKTLKPSTRGELEITDLNNIYLESGNLHVSMLGRGVAWLDTGTPQALLDASQFVSTIEKRQGLMIACLEEVAYRMDYISYSDLRGIAAAQNNETFRDYLLSIAERRSRSR